MTNSNITKQTILDTISHIVFKNGDRLVSKISEIIIKNNNIGFSIDISGISIEEAQKVKLESESLIKNIGNLDKVTIVLTSSSGEFVKSQKPKHIIEGVKKVLLVSAAKGGVGKSTVSVLLAETLVSAGMKVGIVDADIYGPSMPNMFKLSGSPKLLDGKMQPLVSSSGIQVMSIGFLSDDIAIPMAWRGPMASKAIYKLLSLTAWNDLDYLIIDMPPGTGDIHLSIVENYVVGSVLIVTTPQNIAAIDVEKAINLYLKFNIPILGIIENMSYFVDPNSKQEIQIFAGNSGERLSNKYDIPLICKIPLIPELSSACDNGENLADIMQMPNSYIKKLVDLSCEIVNY